MSDLQNKLISLTYPSLLHTGDNNEAFPDNGVVQMEDGTGIKSSLFLGKSGQGAVINGHLDVFANSIGTPNRIVGFTTMHGSNLTLSATPSNGQFTLSAATIRITGTTNNITGITNNMFGTTNNINGITNIGGGPTHINSGLIGMTAGTLHSRTVSCLNFKIRAMDFPVTAVENQVLVGRDGNVKFESIDTITSTNTRTITRTVYNDPQNGLPTATGFTLPQSTTDGSGNVWVGVDITGISPGAKACIFFLRMTPDGNNLGGFGDSTNYLPDGQELILVASNEESGTDRSAYPIYHEAYDSDGSNLRSRSGIQFSCPIRNVAGESNLYFQNRGKGLGKAVNFQIFVIANQF